MEKEDLSKRMTYQLFYHLCVNISDLKFHMVAANFREQQPEVEAMRKELKVILLALKCGATPFLVGNCRIIKCLSF
jgi:hypothetical protein